METDEYVGVTQEKDVVNSLMCDDVKVTGHTVVETGTYEVKTEAERVGQLETVLGQLVTVTS